MKHIFFLLIAVSINSRVLLAQLIPDPYKSYYVYKNDSTNFLREFVAKSQIEFNRKLAKLRMSIAKNSLPEFFCDECLDYNFYSYCIPSVHTVRSLRKDLVDELNLFELASLKRIADRTKKNRLRRICPAKDDDLVFRDISTYDLVCNRIT